MTEIDLNAVINLFALQASCLQETDRGTMRSALSHYLEDVRDLRDAAPYLDLYREMLETQDFMPAEGKETTAGEVSSKLRSRLPRHEQIAMYVKFLEAGAPMAGMLSSAFGLDKDEEAALRNLAGESVSSSSPAGEGAGSGEFMGSFLFIGNACRNVQPQKGIHLLPRPGFEGAVVLLELPGVDIRFAKAMGSDPVSADGLVLPAGIVRRLVPGSILSDARGARIYPYEVEAAFSAASGTGERISFEASHLEFRYPGSADIGLHDFSVSLEGGNLVAIMGGSGAGKTTLLSILTGKLKPDSGIMRINGLEWGSGGGAAEGIVGYVPQDDLLFEDLTVFENLYYNARLCLAHLDDKEIRARCEMTLKELNQLETAGLRVGTPLDKTISGGQRKRLNIALELIREPPVLFLDEPTSGLSSADSENVISLLKAQAAKGRIVVATIHQPSSTVYRMFDRLWLLDKGGRPIFDGNPLDALVHFRTEGYRTGNEEYACPHCGTVHPEQLFEIIEEMKVDANGHATRERKVPPAEWHARYLKVRNASAAAGAGAAGDSCSGTGPGSMAPAGVPAPAALSAPEHSAAYLNRPGRPGQYRVFFARTMRSRLANKGYLLLNLLEPPLLAVVAGLLFHGAWGATYVFRDNVNIPGYFFMSMVIAVFLGLMVASDEIHRDLKILERERLLRLDWGSYIASKASWLALVAVYQMLVYAVVGNLILRVPGMTFFMWAVLASSSFCASILGLIVSASMKSAVSIYILIPMLLVPQIMLGGPTINYNELIRKNSGNRNVPLVAEVIPTRWGYEAVMVEHFTGNRFERRLFDDEKILRRMDYMKDIHLPEVRGLASKAFAEPDPLGSAKAQDRALRQALAALGNELACLERFSGLKAPDLSGFLVPGKYGREHQALITAYLKEFEAWLKPIRADASSKKRASEAAMREEFGNAGFEAFKARNFNKEVEKQALQVNLGDRDSVVLSGTRLVPQVAPIVLDPESKLGRAPLFSTRKRLGPVWIPTPIFNLIVLWVMTGLLYAVLWRLGAGTQGSQRSRKKA
jgi:ABC-type multidrug transport system ATPase subunit/ABC-type multidrug transport system permease subunit